MCLSWIQENTISESDTGQETGEQSLWGMREAGAELGTTGQAFLWKDVEPRDINPTLLDKLNFLQRSGRQFKKWEDGAPGEVLNSGDHVGTTKDFPYFSSFRLILPIMYDKQKSNWENLSMALYLERAQNDMTIGYQLSNRNLVSSRARL